MNTTGIEIETKFYVRDVQRIETRLHELGARLVQARVHEINLRFDQPDGMLGKTFRILRLRQDEQVILTYKGAGTALDGIRAREEWEVVVSNFTTMQKILESLGYVIQYSYEKYRTTYSQDDTLVMLDEMPYGSFVEIEGANQTSIFFLADRLELDRSTALSESYQVLFERVQTALGLSFRDLSFENFTNIQVPASALGITVADKE
jgi:adenylate cyclase, class 2